MESVELFIHNREQFSEKSFFVDIVIKSLINDNPLKKLLKLPQQYFVFERNARDSSNDLKTCYIVN